MENKIKEPVLNELIIECYDAILGKGFSREEMFSKVKETAIPFLENKGYKLVECKVKCDYENNPPSEGPIEKIFVKVFEENFPGYPGYIYHEFVL